MQRTPSLFHPQLPTDRGQGQRGADDNFLPLGYDVLDSWVWADHVRRNDTIRVRKYGYNLKVESEEDDRGPYKVDYSDHYPVLVHLEMNR